MRCAQMRRSVRAVAGFSIADSGRKTPMRIALPIVVEYPQYMYLSDIEYPVLDGDEQRRRMFPYMIRGSGNRAEEL